MEKRSAVADVCVFLNERKGVAVFSGIGSLLCLFYSLFVCRYLYSMQIPFDRFWPVIGLEVSIELLAVVCLGASSVLILKGARGSRGLYLFSLLLSLSGFVRGRHFIAALFFGLEDIFGAGTVGLMHLGTAFHAVLFVAAVFFFTRSRTSPRFEKGYLSVKTILGILVVFFCVVAVAISYVFLKDKEGRIDHQGFKVGPLRVLYYHGTGREVARRVPLNKVRFWFQGEPGEPCRQLGSDVCLKGVGVKPVYVRGYCDLAVYDSTRFLGISLYYNVANGGLYVQDLESIDGVVSCRGKDLPANARLSYYRVGDMTISEDKLTVILKRGAFFAYRKAASFSWGKDSNAVKMHIPVSLDKPDFVTYMVIEEHRVRECLP